MQNLIYAEWSLSANYLSTEAKHAPFLFCLKRCALYRETFYVEKFKTQEETYYSDNITIVPREIVFIVIAIRYNVFSNKIEYK